MQYLPARFHRAARALACANRFSAVSATDATAHAETAPNSLHLAEAMDYRGTEEIDSD